MLKRITLMAAAVLFGAGLVALAAHRPGPAVFVQPDDEELSQRSACPRGTPESKGAAALAMIAYPWDSLGYRFVFEGPKRGFLAVTNTGTKTIEVYVRQCQGVDQLATVVGHEIGHAIDDRYLSPADREQVQRYRGYSPREWYGCNRCTDYATPAGDFAEAVAYIIAPPGRFRSLLAGPPGDGAQREAIEQYLRRR